MAWLSRVPYARAFSCTKGEQHVQKVLDQHRSACDAGALRIRLHHPAPAQRTWKVKPASIKVIDQEDWDPGDEPYVIQLGFRSKLGVPESSSAFVVSQCKSPSAMPANNVGTPGTAVPIPAGSADVVFPAVQNLDVGDVLLKTAPLEIFGTLTFAMGRDAVFTESCAITDMLRNVLVGTLADALDLLIAGANTPPTQEALIDLIVDHLGDFVALIPGLIAAALEGLGNPDDILGVAAQIHLPTAGAFTDLMKFGLALAGLDNGAIERGSPVLSQDPHREPHTFECIVHVRRTRLQSRPQHLDRFLSHRTS
ncbi:MAG: hypothetical protein M5U19_21435 [Microthrixaceae bacterium]|nr:hypothetical protein [Microthrixaceae bacterium]